jgi:nucleoside-diphosphate-sugar epimerase
VTGASGFVGGHLAEALQAQGAAVRAVYRREQAPPFLAGLEKKGAEVRRLDLTRAGEAREAVRGMEAVVHAAGLAHYWGPYERFRIHNYDLTVRLLEEARAAGCRVFVYTSSVVVHGFGPHPDTREEGPYLSLWHPYAQTKKMAEEFVLSRNGEGFRTTAIRPANVYGPRDTTITARILQALESGALISIGGGTRRIALVYIDDLVQALILALRCAESGGQAFNIAGGESVSLQEVLEYAFGLMGIRPLRLGLPPFLAFGLAGLLEVVYRRLGARGAPPLARYLVAQLAYDYHFRIDRAREVLGYRPQVGYREGIARTLRSFGRIKG